MRDFDPWVIVLFIIGCIVGHLIMKAAGLSPF